MNEDTVASAPHPGSALTKVVVAVATYRRPEALRRTLASLAAQQLDPGVQLVVHVVDNDPDAGAAAIVAALAQAFPWPLHYQQEPRPGCSHVRNRALEAMPADCDALAFIDDDEVAAQDWLQQLLRVQMRFDADAVSGPVRRVFPRHAPSWARQAAFFRSPKHPDGARLRRAATGNVLLRAKTLRRMALRFDPRLSASGGEDELFFRELAARGGEIRWAASAVVTELVERERIDRRWILRRSMGHGNASTRIQFIRRSPPLALLAVMALVLLVGWRAVAGLLKSGPGARCTWWIDLLSAASVQLGLLSGLLGMELHSYGQRSDCAGAQRTSR